MDSIDFNLDALTEDQLRALNRAVVERLRSLGEARTAHEMRAFEPGDLVTFEHRGEDGHRTVCGLVIKINRKTVSLLDETRTRWNVSPGLLTRVDAAAATAEEPTRPPAAPHTQPPLLRPALPPPPPGLPAPPPRGPKPPPGKRKKRKRR